jgi:hypothetical protein
MSKTTRTTITINNTVLRSLKLRAAETDTTVSKLVETAVTHQVLEDYEDIEDAANRQTEPELSFDDLVKTYRSEGLL